MITKEQVMPLLLEACPSFTEKWKEHSAEWQQENLLYLDKKISRVEASDWAFKLREAEDNNNLEYIPEDSESLIWDGIIFIEGIDLKNTPNTYLHKEIDIQMFLQNL